MYLLSDTKKDKRDLEKIKEWKQRRVQEDIRRHKELEDFGKEELLEDDEKDTSTGP